ncbi:MAG: pyrroline-5-carboxylate reductase [Methylococcales bacterium]|nr:pyrroline-5-carboxylate reductase [Methylococcales bacterium]
MKTKNIGFIGGGNMATSLIKGLIASGHPPQQIWVSDVDAERLKNLSSMLQIKTTLDNNLIIENVNVVVLAIKPQVLRKVAEKIVPALKNSATLVVSIAAGINQNSLSQWLGQSTAIVRCMPNTPALVLTGATALHANINVSNTQKDLAENILRAVGIALWVKDEKELDAVTAVSGSGPAYYFLLMEAMEQSAIELGLSQQTARLLIQQTALGAAKIALELDESPEQLRKQVTSPNGTTQTALEVFEQGGFKPLVSKALRAAKERSITMSEQLGAT